MDPARLVDKLKKKKKKKKVAVPQDVTTEDALPHAEKQGHTYVT